MSTGPSIATHIPVTMELPDEPDRGDVDRPVMPTPSLWQVGVKVKHRETGREAVVRRIEYATNQFRAWFPNEGESGEDGKPRGRWSERTQWERCDDWKPEVTLSPAELERQKIRAEFEGELAKVDPAMFEDIKVLCDDADPAKALAKLKAYRRMGAMKPGK